MGFGRRKCMRPCCASRSSVICSIWVSCCWNAASFAGTSGPMPRSDALLSGKVDARMIRHLVAVVAGMATAAWLIGARPAHAADPIKLKVGTQSLIDTAPFEAAKAQGYFLAEGLDVEATSMIGGA